MTSFLKSDTFKRHFWKYFLLLVLVGLIIVFFFSFSFSSCSSERFKEKQVIIPDGTILETAIADNINERSLGLSICDNLASNQAMLFIFNKPDIYSFWMKDMHFPIDIFWLDEHRQVVFVHKDAQPEEYQQGINYLPDVDALYVLETVSGFAESHQIGIGNQLSW